MRHKGWMGGLTTALALALAGCSSDEAAGPDEPNEPEGCPAAGAGIERSTLGAFDSVAGTPVRRVVLMGGSTEVDPAARAFVEAAGGGDVLVLRASGSTTTYTPYFFTELSADPAPSSATTIRIDDPAQSSSEAVLCVTTRSEAVWLAGGDQWDYVGGWTPALHDELAGLFDRGIAIGGTSAGAMVLGEFAFDASRGSITSGEALANPLSVDVSVSISPMAQPELAGWIVDSHFRQRDREGRLLAFLARALSMSGGDVVHGIGLDERASLVIEDGSYEAMAVTGRYVWLYRVAGTVTLVAGEPLDLPLVLRRRLESGETGGWPPSFEDADTVRVTAGVLENGI
jgi:cyanophycinase-like exopeptidase